MTLVLLVAYMTLRPWCMADTSAAAAGSYKALWLEGLQGLKGVSGGVKRDESGCFKL